MLIKSSRLMIIGAILVLTFALSIANATSYQVKDAHFTVRMPEKWTRINQETFSWLKDLVGVPDAKVGFFYDSEEPDLRVSPIVLMQWQDLYNPEMIRFVSRAHEEYRKVARVCYGNSDPYALPRFCLDSHKNLVSRKTALQTDPDGLTVRECYYLGRNETIMGLFFVSHNSDTAITSNLIAPIIKDSGFHPGYGYVKKWRLRSNLAILSLLVYIGAVIWLFWIMYFRSRSQKYASLDLIDYDSVHYESYKSMLLENKLEYPTGFLEKCLVEVVARGKRPDLIDLLRSMGASFKHRYPGDITILMCACASQTSLEVIDMLARDIEDINETDANGMTALLYAITGHSDIKIINYLIDWGADVNLADRSGTTPLMYACKEALNPELVNTLLENGADTNRLDSNGRNAFSHAMKNNRLRNTPLLSRLTNQ